MDFQLTDDQRAIADMAGSLFGDLCTDDRLRAFDTAGEPFMADLWKQCVETGLHALAIPGGRGRHRAGHDRADAGARGPGPRPRPRAAVAPPAWRCHAGALRWCQAGAEIAAAAAESKLMITLALGAAARAHGVALKARREGDGWVLDGKVAAVALGAEVCRALLLAETDDGPRLVSVNLRDAGIEKVPGVFTHREAVADLGFSAHRLAADAVLPEAALPWLEQRAIAATRRAAAGGEHRAGAPHRRVHQRPPPVRPRHRHLPGGADEHGRRPHRHRGAALRAVAAGVSPGRRPAVAVRGAGGRSTSRPSAAISSATRRSTCMAASVSI